MQHWSYLVLMYAVVESAVHIIRKFLCTIYCLLHPTHPSPALFSLFRAISKYQHTEKDLELTNCALLAKTKTFDEMEQNLANIGSKYELEKQTLLAQKDAEHAQHLVQVDERIRKMLAAKDLELSNIRGILRAKETKLKASEEALAQINREIVSIKKR